MDTNSRTLLLLLIALVVASGLYLYERSERIDAEQTVFALKEVNKANDEAIRALKDFQKTTDAAVVAFAESKDGIDKLRKTVNTSMQRLLTSNEEFRVWFTSVLHADAVRLYNETKYRDAARGAGK